MTYMLCARIKAFFHVIDMYIILYSDRAEIFLLLSFLSPLLLFLLLLLPIIPTIIIEMNHM